jgi:hypothetical protein
VQSKWPEERFSTEAWRKALPDGRYVFYEDLMGRRLIENHTRAEIIALFGKPDFKERQLLTYVLKSSDALWKLEIPIDSQGRTRRPVLRAD